MNKNRRTIQIEYQNRQSSTKPPERLQLCQAVACAFAEEMGIDESIIFKMMEGHGLGMGCMEGTCGAVTAACVIAGAKNSTVEMGGPGSKGATYKISKEIVRRFKEESGSVICKELKGVETGTPAKACPDCVKDAPAYWKRLYLASRKVTCPLEAAYNKRKRRKHIYYKRKKSKNRRIKTSWITSF